MEKLVASKTSNSSNISNTSNTLKSAKTSIIINEKQSKVKWYTNIYINWEIYNNNKLYLLKKIF